MGNCLPKQKKKKRKGVKLKRTPREEKQPIDEILSKSSNCQKQNQNEPTDMTKALNGDGKCHKILLNLFEHTKTVEWVYKIDDSNV